MQTLRLEKSLRICKYAPCFGYKIVHTLKAYPCKHYIYAPKILHLKIHTNFIYFFTLANVLCSATLIRNSMILQKQAAKRSTYTREPSLSIIHKIFEIRSLHWLKNITKPLSAHLICENMLQ